MSNVVLMGAAFIPLAASYGCHYLHYCLAFPQKDLNLEGELVSAEEDRQVRLVSQVFENRTVQ